MSIYHKNKPFSRNFGPYFKIRTSSKEVNVTKFLPYGNTRVAYVATKKCYETICCPDLAWAKTTV